MSEVSLFIYDTALLDEQAIADYVVQLPEEELQHYHRLQHQDDKNTFAVARGLLRQQLASLMGRNPKTVYLSKTDNGKIFWQGAPAITFNISHSGAYMALAISSEANELGIDIEPINREVNIDRLSARNCHPEEIKQINNIENQQQHFMKLWTLKESTIKMLGEKISSLPLNSFGFVLDEGIEVFSENPVIHDATYQVFRAGPIFLSLAAQSNFIHIKKIDSNIPGLELTAA